MQSHALDTGRLKSDPFAMTAEPTAPKPPASKTGARAMAVRIFKTYLAPRWVGLTASVVCAVVVAATSAELIALLNPATNNLIAVKPKPDAWIVIPAAILVLAVLRGLSQVGQATLVNQIGNAIVGDVQVQLFGKLIRSDLARLRGAHTGSYVSSVLYDAGLIREAATSGVVNYTQHFLTVVGALGVMVYEDPVLALGVVLVSPIVMLVLQRYARRTNTAAGGAMNETSALLTAVMESLDGVKIVKIDNREAYEEARVAQVVARRQVHLVKAANARATAAPATETLVTFVVAGVLAYAGWRATVAGPNLGVFVAFFGALMMANQSLRQLAILQTVMAEGLTAAGRLFPVLDVEPAVRDAADARALPKGAATIAFQDVAFAYGGDAQALHGVSLEARRGETIALVGPSGGGKSTILNLIPRFYDVTAGSISIDGFDVRGVSLASLRDQIALVTQEPFLFDDTVRANIAYARPDASQAEVEAAAREAAAHDFILQLPGGYDTPVGEAGARLSGGQKQRIAIARAFLKNAPILLLDEATSALDTESEAQVQAALERLMAGRTTVLIAHRLSTVKGADRIYVIDAGRVVQTGAHAGLMRQRGLYARLAQAQDLDAAPAPEAAE
jgi:subfamily B ATP-binding cassette protein MsbA